MVLIADWVGYSTAAVDFRCSGSQNNDEEEVRKQRTYLLGTLFKPSASGALDSKWNKVFARSGLLDGMIPCMMQHSVPCIKVPSNQILAGHISLDAPFKLVIPSVFFFFLDR